MSKFSFRAILTSKTLVQILPGEKLVKLEFVEEREIPGPIITTSGSQSEMLREIMPIVNQVLKSVAPRPRVSFPRINIFLTEEEWDRITSRPEVGEEALITIEEKNGKLIITIEK